MRSGQLRHRVNIESRATGSVGTRGQATETWSKVATVMAKIKTLSGRELEYAKQLIATASHEVTIRHRSGVTNKHRIVFGSKTFNIDHVNDMAEKPNRWLILTCSEGV